MTSEHLVRGKWESQQAIKRKLAKANQRPASAQSDAKLERQDVPFLCSNRQDQASVKLQIRVLSL